MEANFLIICVLFRDLMYRESLIIVGIFVWYYLRLFYLYKASESLRNKFNFSLEWFCGFWEDSLRFLVFIEGIQFYSQEYRTQFLMKLWFTSFYTNVSNPNESKFKNTKVYQFYKQCLNKFTSLRLIEDVGVTNNLKCQSMTLLHFIFCEKSFNV